MRLPSRAFRRSREVASGLLFDFRASDVSLTARTGQILTSSRSASRTVRGSDGRIITLAQDQLPWSSLPDSDGQEWPVLQPGLGVGNAALHSEDFSNWSAIGTPTLVAAARRCGDVALSLVGDDASGTAEGYKRSVSFATSINGIKHGVSFFIAQGTSTSTVIRLRDTSASADRVLGAVTWSNGAPVVTMTTGTLAYVLPHYGGVYRILLLSGDVTAANSHELEIYPSTTAALSATPTGNVFVGGFQASLGQGDGWYSKTAGSAASPALDSVQCDNVLPLSDFSVYVRLLRAWDSAVPNAGQSSNLIQNHPGGAITKGAWVVYLTPVINRIQVACYDGASPGITDATPATGPDIEACVQFEGLAAGTLRARVDAGSGFGSYSTPVSVTEWESDVLRMVTYTWDVGLRVARIAPGLRTLDQMRAF